jgi:hypothetical protein
MHARVASMQWFDQSPAACMKETGVEKVASAQLDNGAGKADGRARNGTTDSLRAIGRLM